jgi:hypothetical protein
MLCSRLTGVENALLNLEPYIFPLASQLVGKVDPDVAAFGFLLFEMTLGYAETLLF